MTGSKLVPLKASSESLHADVSLYGAYFLVWYMSSYSFRLASVSIGLLLVLGFSSFFLVQTDNDSYNMAELLKREWVEVSQRDSSLNELRVLSFNVLADGLSQVGAGHWVQTLTS